MIDRLNVCTASGCQGLAAATWLQIAFGCMTNPVMVIADVATVLLLLRRLLTQSSAWEAQPSCAATSHVFGVQQSECGQQLRDTAGLDVYWRTAVKLQQHVQLPSSSVAAVSSTHASC
jgi:hypothetical protein